MILPGLLGTDNIGPIVTVLQLDIGLLRHSIQVLVETVEEKGQEFLGIILLKSTESWCVLSNCPLSK
jgi:hypothetical protein